MRNRSTLLSIFIPLLAGLIVFSLAFGVAYSMLSEHYSRVAAAEAETGNGAKLVALVLALIFGAITAALAHLRMKMRP